MYYLSFNNKIEIKEYNSFFKKLKGLMFKKKIDYAIRLKNCNCIHTFFMKQGIDVVITDKDNKILFYKENVLPNKIILPVKNGYYTYEFPLKVLNNIKLGNTFIINKN